MCYSTSVLIKPTWRLHQSLEVYFASTTQPVHTRQQCSYMGAWASQAPDRRMAHLPNDHELQTRIP